MTKQKYDRAFILKALQEAQEVAARHARAYVEQHGDNQYPCGFAWVNIKPARGLWITVMKEIGLGRLDSYYGGWHIYNPSAHSTQNMEVKAAGAEAFAAELRKYGLKAEAKTRID
jgi:hypothetical protein